MMNQLYAKYFQKSTTFLYPLLGFEKNRNLAPLVAFLTWENRFTVDDRKLICFFKRHKNDQMFADFELNKLLNHPMLDFCEELPEDSIVYVFDMTPVASDYDLFLQGKYSKMSGDAKDKIAHYFGISSPEFVYIESYLYPEKYHRVYAELLGEKLSVIQEVHELCDKYNPDQEHFTFIPEKQTT